MHNGRLGQPARRQISFFCFSRLLLQPDGSFIARPAGMFAAETLDQALATATIQARTAGPLLFRLDKVLQPSPT
jgi:hypothetical protein